MSPFVFSLWMLCFAKGALSSYSVDYMMGKCGKELDWSSRSYGAGYVYLAQSWSYLCPLECGLTIRARPGQQLLARITNLDLAPSYECVYELLALYDSGSQIAHVLCGSTYVDHDFPAQSGLLRIGFWSGLYDWDGDCRGGFEIVVTAFTTGPCSNNTFQCTTGARCISSEFRCDNINNCGDWSDEHGCPLSGGEIAAIVCCSIFGAILIAGLIGYCWHRRVKKQKKESRGGTRGEVLYDPAMQYPPPQTAHVYHDSPPAYPTK